MKKIVSTALMLCILSFSFAQKKTAYTIYNSKGKKVSYAKMLKTIAKNDILLFGEYHNNPISHWLQFELSQDLLNKKDLVLGAEMFETDNQIEVSKYLKDEIDAETLDTTARLWKNFKTDYKPLLDLAKDNNLNFVACNIPRRFAKMVYLNGFEVLDTLAQTDKNWIAPLPIKYDPELPGYQAMLEMMGGHGGENLPKAQAIKDATMAYNILKNWKENQLFIHYNGSYHSNNYEGIYWYLKQANENLNISTITTVSQENPFKILEENKGLADFIIVVDENMTTTY